jgi:hypothetical protein
MTRTYAVWTPPSDFADAYSALLVAQADHPLRDGTISLSHFDSVLDPSLHAPGDCMSAKLIASSSIAFTPE